MNEKPTKALLLFRYHIMLYFENPCYYNIIIVSESVLSVNVWFLDTGVSHPRVNSSKLLYLFKIQLII